jgi:plastocyanin
VRRRAAFAASLAALAFAPAAYGQGATVQAVDGTEADGFNNRWAPPAVTIKAGETVTWSFAGTTALHNVVSRGSNWSYRNGDPVRGGPSGSFTFPTPGVFEYVCEVHVTTMVGTVTVTDASGTPPPPPPPPPPSEQHWANDQPSPTQLEVVDEQKPRLSRVRVSAVRDGGRVRFRLSERAQVIVRFKLAGVTVKRAARTFRKGAGSLTVRDRRMHGRYKVEVLARDLAGNRSRVRSTRLTVRP